MASVVARALVAVDAEKASKQDLELLKKLVMEFKDELDALGVKVDKIDKRVAVLEDSLGGWKLSGQFWFDANFAGGDQANSAYTESGLDTDFQKDRFRLTLQKQISDTTSFYAQFRGGSESAGSGSSGYGDITVFNIRQIYVDTVLPYDINYRVGRFFLDFEDDHGLYVDNDAIFGDYRVDGFQFLKNWGSFSAKAVVGRNTGFDRSYTETEEDRDLFANGYMNYALDLTWQPNEKFFAGVNGNWFNEDGDPVDGSGKAIEGDFSTYSVYASYSFTPAITLQGLYYWQDLDEDLLGNGKPATATENSPTEDSPKAWKATLDVKQDLLKFTSFRFEYMQQDNTFLGARDPYSFGVDSGTVASISDNMPWNDGTTNFFFVYADQKWNDKWSSYLRYQQADFDTTGLDDAKGYGVGVTYQYTPAVAFRLAYDCVDYGDGHVEGGFKEGKDHVFQFRTAINF
ncbi:MAG: S-layer homology domain-containing protein [Synergistaceae bacterium]|nr:S-layer homology domain-containing protein [Synergistaceae bacterium]